MQHAERGASRPVENLLWPLRRVRGQAAHSNLVQDGRRGAVHTMQYCGQRSTSLTAGVRGRRTPVRAPPYLPVLIYLLGPLCMAGYFGPQLSARLRSSAALSGASASRSVSGRSRWRRLLPDELHLHGHGSITRAPRRATLESNVQLCATSETSSRRVRP